MKFFTIVVAFLLAAVSVSAADLARGFGDKYDWKSLDDGLAESKASGKPAMIVIHKSWCGACKALGPKFGDSNAILEAAADFVMINIQDDDEPTGADKDQYSPDGGYIPRILFSDPSTGKVDADMKVPNGNPKYGYYYSSPDQIVQGMKVAKAKLSTDGAGAAAAGGDDTESLDSGHQEL